MKKNKIFIGILVLVLLILFTGTGIWSYEYWWEGTPEYSLQQLEQARADHDTTTADEYINANAIWNSVWTRYESLATSAGGYNLLLVAALKTYDPIFEQAFKNGIYEDIRGTATSTTPSMLSLAAGQKFEVHGDSAMLNINYATNATTTYPITLVFQQQPDRTWQLVDMQGYEQIFFDATKSAITSGNF